MPISTARAATPGPVPAVETSCGIASARRRVRSASAVGARLGAVDDVGLAIARGTFLPPEGDGLAVRLDPAQAFVLEAG